MLILLLSAAGVVTILVLAIVFVSVVFGQTSPPTVEDLPLKDQRPTEAELLFIQQQMLKAMNDPMNLPFGQPDDVPR